MEAGKPKNYLLRWEVRMSVKVNANVSLIAWTDKKVGDFKALD